MNNLPNPQPTDLTPQKKRRAGAPKGNRNSVGANTGKRNAALPFETSVKQLTLDGQTIETLARLGLGNLSAGVRYAARQLAHHNPQDVWGQLIGINNNQKMMDFGEWLMEKGYNDAFRIAICIEAMRIRLPEYKKTPFHFRLVGKTTSSDEATYFVEAESFNTYEIKTSAGNCTVTHHFGKRWNAACEALYARDEAVIVADLDGTLIPYGNNNQPADAFNHALATQWQRDGVKQIAIATNQGGMNFATGSNKYPTPEIVARRIAYAVEQLATHGITTVRIIAATYHPKASEAQTKRSANELYIAARQLARLPIVCEYEEQHRKPNAGMLTRLGAEIYYGDSPEDAQAASAAGCQFVQVERF